MAFFGGLRDTVVSVSHCCFEETFDDDAVDHVDGDDDYDNDMEWYRTPEPAIFQLFDPIVTLSLRVFDEREFTNTHESMSKKNTYKIIKKNDGTNSSAVTTVSGCVHVNKAINFTAMKKGLKQQVFGQCAGCVFEVLNSSNTDLFCSDITRKDTWSDNLLYVSETTTIHVCLQCGYQGCGIDSPGRHASSHLVAMGSTSHALLINTTTWMVCCQECNEEIPVVHSKRLVKCMKHLQKLARVPNFDSFKGRDISLTRKIIAWIGDVYTACCCKTSVEVENQVAANVASVSAASFNVNSLQERKGPSSQKVMGLHNVGNTCYFNAAMQTLIQTYSLLNLLMERSIEGGPLLLPGKRYISDNSRTYTKDEDDYQMDLPSIRVNLSQARPVTMALANFLQEINSATQTDIVNPTALFGQVCNEAPMFRGNQQHDSHELLSHMLGIMRSEEVKRGQIAVLKYFELAVNSNPQAVDHDVRMKVRNYGYQVNYTFVDALFGGCLVSTVMCEECHYISQTFEPFQDLSLPVQEVKTSSLASLYNIVPVEGKKEGEEEKGDRKSDLKEAIVPVEGEKEGEDKGDMGVDGKQDIVHVEGEEEEDREADVKDNIVALEGEMGGKEENGDSEADMKDNFDPVEVKKEGKMEGYVDKDVKEEMGPVEGENRGKDANVKEDMTPLEVENEGKEEKDMKENIVPLEWEKEAQEEADVEETIFLLEVEKESKKDEGDSDEDVMEDMSPVEVEKEEKEEDIIKDMVPMDGENDCKEKEGEMEVDMMEDMIPVKWEVERDKVDDLNEDMVPEEVEKIGMQEERKNVDDLNEDIIFEEGHYEGKKEEENMMADVIEDMVLVEWEKENEENENKDKVEDLNEDVAPVEGKKEDREEEDRVDVKEYVVPVERELESKEEEGDREAGVKEDLFHLEWEKEDEKEEGDKVGDQITYMIPEKEETEGNRDENVKRYIIPVEEEKYSKEEEQYMEEDIMEDIISMEWEYVGDKKKGDKVDILNVDIVPVAGVKKSKKGQGHREEDVMENMVPVECEKEDKADKGDNVDDLNEDIVPVEGEKKGMKGEGDCEKDVMEDIVPVEWEREIEEGEGDMEEDVKEEMVSAEKDKDNKDEEDNEDELNEDVVLSEGEYESKEEEGDMDKDMMEDMVSAERKKESKKLGDRDEDVKANIVPMEVEREGDEFDREEDTMVNVVYVEVEYEGNEEQGYMEDMVPREWEKEFKEEEEDMEEDLEDTKDMKEEKSDADIKENMERDIIKYSHSLEASIISDLGSDGSAENGMEPSQSPVHISPHILPVLTENTPTQDASVSYNLIPSGVAIWETEDTDGFSKEIHNANGEIHKSQVTQPVEYMNRPVANGYPESGTAGSEEPMELETATSSILLSSSSYKQLSTGEQVISDVTSGTNNSSVSETCSSGFSQDLSLNMLYQSSEESEKVKDLDEPVNNSQSSVSDDTGISTQGTRSLDSATVGNNEIQLKAGNDQDKSTSFNVQHMKSSEFEDPQPVRSRKEIWKEGKRKSILTLAPRYHSASSECSIESCLNLFTSSELLTGSNKFGCKNCTKIKKKSNPNKEIKTVYSDASKKYLIIQPPAVLTLHLKRFEQLEVKKINKLDRHVDFPFVLDLAPYCSALCENVKPGQKKILYSLYGVVEHIGDLRYGHYTAYVKVRPSITSLTNFLNTHHASVKEYLNQYTENVLRMGVKMEKETEEDYVSEFMVPPGQWFHISDTRISKVTEATVKHAQAYMLFYERIF
ncbi:hypothetical protein ACJMK2_019065 [Sinanodonta woodiana]|uniref:ubiquitinyl hydrolase 1 n=1 Tax=Sinanodonta woodiana TaxID=1069815 RepID=A0ABD3UHB6_SINWO